MKEVYNEVPQMQHDLENAPNLNVCRDAIGNLLNGGAPPSDIKKNDKVNKAQEIVDQAKKLMSDNVSEMIKNQTDFTGMENKSRSIKETAFNMKNNAKALEREARKRNCRLWAIIICLIISVLVYIIVPIVATQS